MSRLTNAFMLFAATALLVSCTQSEAEQEAAARKAATPLRVERDGSIRLSATDRVALNLAVATVGTGSFSTGTIRFGKLESAATDEVVVAAPVSGIVAASTLVAGSAIAAGSILFTITPAFDASERVTLGVQAADLNGQIAQLEKELPARDAEAARTRELGRERIVSVAQQQSAEAEAAAGHARLAALRREGAAQQRSSSRTVTVRTPMSGSLAELRAAAGSAVRRGDPMARIVRNGGSLFIDLPVGASEPAGDSYSVLAGGVWSPAHLVTRGAAADASGLRHDRLALDAVAASLLPGSTLSVRISHGAGGGILIPESAVVATARGDVVYVESSSGIFQQRAVHVAERSETLVRIDQGLSAGESIVVRGVMGLYGESVRSALE